MVVAAPNHDYHYMRLIVLQGTILERKLRWFKITFRYLESEAGMPSPTKHSYFKLREVSFETQVYKR